MNAFDLHVLATDKPFFEGKCLSLVLPTKTGQYGIQAGHCNWIASVIPGEMKITCEDEKGEQNVILAAVADGIVKVENGSVLVLVDTAERPEEIDENRARRAVDKAREDVMRKQSKREYYASQARLARAINRLKVSGHRH